MLVVRGTYRNFCLGIDQREPSLSLPVKDDVIITLKRGRGKNTTLVCEMGFVRINFLFHFNCPNLT